MTIKVFIRSNNTNKLSPQERREQRKGNSNSSNNTNKLSPQEREKHRRKRKIWFK